MKETLFLLIASMVLCLSASGQESISRKKEMTVAGGHLVLTPLADNALRVQFHPELTPVDTLPSLLYTSPASKQVKPSFKVAVNNQDGTLTILDAKGRVLTTILSQQLLPSAIHGKPTHEARLKLSLDDGESLWGLGQFQDGLSDLAGMTRRLTQVNTQISMPVMLSSNGYGIVWNNYGRVDFNPPTDSLRLTLKIVSNQAEDVNVTSTEGGVIERRRDHVYAGTLDIPQDGEYCLLLDVGRGMGSRYNISVDGKQLVDWENSWFPPTYPVRVSLTKGRHAITSILTDHDSPIIYYRCMDATTTFSSPVSDCVDYTILTGSPDEIISSYRNITGGVPLMPRWALGFIHCRERYHSSAEILDNAREFRRRQLPIDMIVQDWQYWGDHGWNSMEFDRTQYPSPSDLTAQLHDSLSIHLMLSVWSKIDIASPLGQRFDARGYFIPGTSWVDFFNHDAAEYYWQNMRDSLLRYNIDAWWQDATEPENDDLVGRTLDRGRLLGEQMRNAYPLLVSRTVYEGLQKDDPGRRVMILTRSGFPGIHRYGSTLWSGDVGHDWTTLRHQILGGLGLMAAGHPWWTFDAGGFFRPTNQYTDKAYIHRMLRWIEVATFLPVMRIHGYMSETEPWRYGAEAEEVIRRQLNLRYQLLPYIYTEASEVSRKGRTLMRPLIFDFAHDKEALRHPLEYMFGKALLISPITEPDVVEQQTYLPETEGGWYDFYTNQHYEGGQTVTTQVDIDRIPVFVRAGSIIPMGPIIQQSEESAGGNLTFHIYPGKDAEYELYEDEGDNYNYKQGAFRTTLVQWNDAKRTHKIEQPKGSYNSMNGNRYLEVVVH